MIATQGRAPRGTSAARGALPVNVASRGLVAFDVTLDPRDVVFVKGVVEASDGLASIFAEQGGSGGDLCVACPASRAAELRALLSDLGCEGRERLAPPGSAEADP